MEMLNSNGKEVRRMDKRKICQNCQKKGKKGWCGEIQQFVPRKKEACEKFVRK